MREARNDEVYASRMHSASPRLAISALRSVTNSPVCARFARLDWGYEKLCLSRGTVSRHLRGTVSRCLARTVSRLPTRTLHPQDGGRRDADPPTRTSRKLHRAAGTFLSIRLAPHKGRHGDDPDGRTRHGRQSPPHTNPPSLKLSFSQAPVLPFMLPFGSRSSYTRMVPSTVD